MPAFDTLSRVFALPAIFAQRQTASLPDQRHGGRWAGRTAAGIHITPDRSLRTDTVWACARYLTGTVGQLPARIRKLRPDGSGKSDPVSGALIHPVDYALNWRPNPELAPFQLRETLMFWALFWGNGYAEIERDGAGRLVALWPLEPWRVKPMRDDATGALFYRVNNGSKAPQSDLAASDVFHVRGMGNGPVGLSVVEYAAQSIGWAQATELFGATFFGEGMSFSGAITLQGRGSADSITRMRDELEDRHRGVAKSNRWLFLDNGAKVERMSASPDEAQFIATMQHQTESICRWFGVPPQKVGHLLRMTFNNVEQLSIEVVQDAITPWAKRFEEEATFKLFGANRQNLFCKFDLKALLRGDFFTRQQGLQIQRRNGVINANDWAEIEDMPPIGKDGEKYIVEGNMATLEQLGQAPVPAPQPPAPAAQPQEPAAPPQEPAAQPSKRARQMLARLAQRELAYV